MDAFWRVSASPSMRGLGDLIQHEGQSFTITPDEGSDLQGITAGPYATLNEAMAAIGAFLGGTCRPAPRGKGW